MTIDLIQARELLKQAVETQGREFVYNPDKKYACRYEPIPWSERVDDQDPRHLTGCLVGAAITLTGETFHHGAVMSALALAVDFPDTMTDEAADYFQVAQGVQDGGGTWGEAHDKAERWLWEQLTERNWDASEVAADTLSDAVTELLAKQTGTSN